MFSKSTLEELVASPLCLACLTVILTVAVAKLIKWMVFKKKRTPKPAHVYIIDNHDDCEKKLRLYRENYPHSIQFLGLDCEWVSKKGVLSHPVALLQLATSLNDCFLIRLCKMTGGLPPCLKEILENRNILKFGVGILDDAKKLSNTYGIVVSGCVDLRHLVLRCQPSKETSADLDNSTWQGKMSLGALAYKFLGVQMDKSWHVQCSDWEAGHLSDRQVSYAANDAIVAVHLLMTLVVLKRAEKWDLNSADATSSCNNQEKQIESERAQCTNNEASKQILEVTENYFARTIQLEKYEIHDSKEYVKFAERLISDENFCQVGVSFCKGIVDFGFKLKQKSSKKEGKNNSVRGLKQKPYGRGFTERKSPLYENCQLVAPDGAVLSTIERKKADWYLEKGIGELVGEDPYTVRLKFEPSGRPHEDDSYYLTFKQNICVVCGKGESYLRKNIVPHEYRRHFPLCMKNHHSHDIVLMCPECHRVSSYYDEHLRQRLAREYNAPLGNKEVAKTIQDPVLMKVRSAAKAFVHAGDKIPLERRQVLLKILQDHYNTSDITPELLKEASTMDIHKENINFKSHGEEVVRNVKEQGKLLEFEKMWRSHFVDTVNPQHLPELWSVDHRFEKMKAALDKMEQDGE